MILSPRPYQIECAASVVEKLRMHRSTLVDMATGLGKTSMAANVAKDWPDRVLFLVNRDELMRQAVSAFKDWTGEKPDVEMGSEYAGSKRHVVVGSIQTMMRDNRIKRFNPHEFGLVIEDECHGSVCKSHKKVRDYFYRNPTLKMFGMTATPLRSDQLALGQVFESVAYQYGIADGIADGWLVDVQQQVVHVDGLDFSKVDTVAGDLSKTQIEKILTEEQMLHKIAYPTIELCGDESTLVYCVDVLHSKMMAEILNRYKPGCAVHLSGKTDKEERRHWVKMYKAGKVQYLVAANLFVEGFDAPITKNVVMGRPTKSALRYTQIMGRGTRPLPGTVDGIDDAAARVDAIRRSDKPAMRAIDYVGNAGRHKIITASDVLGGKWGAPVREYAKKNMAADRTPCTIQEAMERAVAEIELEAEEARRRKKIVARADYRVREVSPFDRSALTPKVMQQPSGPKATPAQVWKLGTFGVSEDRARAMTMKQAGAIISKYLKQQEKR